MKSLLRLSFNFLLFILFLIFDGCHAVQGEKNWISIHGPDGQVLEIGKDPDSSFFGIRMGKPGMPFYKVELSRKESGFLPRITIEGDEQFLGMGFFPFSGELEYLSPPAADSVSFFGLSVKRKENPFDSVYEKGVFGLDFSIGPFGLKGEKEKVLKSLGKSNADAMGVSVDHQVFYLGEDADSIYGVLNKEKLFEVKKEKKEN